MNYINLYVNFLKKFLKPQRKLKVVFDCSNGTTGLILKKIFKTGQLINSIPDGNFPAHGPNPMKNYALSDLRLAVKKSKADLGVIFDADGDRVFFIDNQCRLVDPDVISRLLIWHLRAKKIIVDGRTSWLIKNIKSPAYAKALTGKQISKLKIIEAKAGYYFIKKVMRRHNVDFAGERSGHYFFQKFFNADSGILAAIEIINAISRLPYSLADFSDLLPQYYRSPELNFKFNSARNYAENNAELRGKIKKIERKFKKQAIKISKIDGLTMEFKDWRFNLRPSNTEPLIRLNIESVTGKIVSQKIKKFRKMLTG